MEWSDCFSPVSEKLFFRSNKTGDPRFGEVSQPYGGEKFTSHSYAIGGYPDDDGITLNNGRIGAAEAPDKIREFFYKTTPSLFHDHDIKIFDMGNLSREIALEERHKMAARAVKYCLRQGGRWIGLGGGHDYGFSDGSGFLHANVDNKNKPLVINFDAHLDVRPMDKGASSGTPFFRLLTDDTIPPFDFIEIGIQSQCNSMSHMEWVKEKGAMVIPFEEIMMSGESQTQTILKRITPFLIKRRPTYISIDIDGFASAYAMGCSQSWPTGLVPNEIFPLLNILYQKLDVQVLGIYEVSPPLDQDNRTVKLASQLIHQYVGPIG